MFIIFSDSIISLMDTCLLYLFMSLFISKNNITKFKRILPFIILLFIHVSSSYFINASLLRIIIFFICDILFCFIQFKSKWYKYIINIGLYYVLQTIIELFYMTILNLYPNFDAYSAFNAYDISIFLFIIIMRFITLLVILIIKKMLGLSTHQRQWIIFLLMPILTIVFAWLIYPPYWGMNDPEINKLLSYVSVFLVIQNIFVFFYIISLQNSTKQYIRIKEAFDRREEYFRTVKVIQTTIRKMAHDIRHHFIYLMSALDQEDIPKAKAYLNKLDENLENIIPLNVTGHYDIDALLHAKAFIADKLGIHIRVEGVLPPELMVSPIDLSALLGNSIDNAIESTSRLEGKKEITIAFYYNASRLNYTISNPYNGKLQKKSDGYFVSQKGSGLGFEIMDEVVKKYGGALITENDENNFKLTVMLQTPQS